MKTITITKTLDPCDAGLLASAAAHLDSTLEQALSRFIDSEEFSDALCDWLNDGIDQQPASAEGLN